MPQTTPPISWLWLVSGFIDPTHAVASMTRVTFTIVSGSTFTSTNCAPWAAVAYLSLSVEAFDS
jgi:hypothetical protein